MKTVTKQVYYCDFCNKRGLSKGHMLNHELHCTLNPDRECRMCGNNPDLKPLIEKYKNTYSIKKSSDNLDTPYTLINFEWKGKPATSEMILDDVDQCAMCALTIVRLSELTQGYPYNAFVYDHKKACNAWWNAVNEEYERNAERDAMYG